MYGNTYANIYSPQASIDRINKQIAELERIKSQIPQNVPQATNLTQNFQLAPANRDIIRYAVSIEDVQRDMVVGDTPYFSKDMSVVWIKNANGEIKTYELNEIIPKDNRDIQIEYLQAQIEELKRERRTNEPDTTTNGAIANAIEIAEPTNVSTIPGTNEKPKKSARSVKTND